MYCRKEAQEEMRKRMHKIGATALSLTLVVGSLAGCGKKETEPSVEETTLAAETADATSAEAKETASKLLEALDDFDDDLSMELAEKLTGYPFRMTQKGKLKEAVGLIGEFMYDEAAELIKEIMPAIE